jgi:hypothetical protein
MENWNEEKLTEFIKENRDLILKGKPTDAHEIKFMAKLQLRVRHFIDLTPYLVKVAIVTVIIFVASFLVWNSFIRKDKTKPIYKNIIEQFESKKKK